MSGFSFTHSETLPELTLIKDKFSQVTRKVVVNLHDRLTGKIIDSAEFIHDASSVHRLNYEGELKQGQGLFQRKKKLRLEVTSFDGELFVQFVYSFSPEPNVGTAHYFPVSCTIEKTGTHSTSTDE